MGKARLEAFSDGVVAILITIMVLQLQVPEAANWAALQPVTPTLLTYLLSFAMVGIYWNNHHHLLHAAERVNGGTLWANLHLLFWLSLVPFVTAWWGRNYNAALPTAVYGFVLLLAAIAYWILVNTMIAHHGKNSRLAAAIGKDVKGKVSILAYLAAIPLAFLNPWISVAIYIGVALAWLVPDRRIESRVASEHL